MSYDKLSEYVKQISENRLSPLNDIFDRWQEGSTSYADRVYSENPFKYIKKGCSPYLANAVYSYLRRAIQQGFNTIRLGPANIAYDENLTSLDDFSKPGEALIPYFWETVRYDETLRKHLEINQEGSMLVVKINI